MRYPALVGGKKPHVFLEQIKEDLPNRESEAFLGIDDRISINRLNPEKLSSDNTTPGAVAK